VVASGGDGDERHVAQLRHQRRLARHLNHLLLLTGFVYNCTNIANLLTQLFQT
jgi:hypothetical protein